MKRVLTIAGSDSGGGAGIQADLKTITVLGEFGMSAVTALTAQNTLGVREIHPVPPEFVKAQIEAVVQDIGVDAAKTGMLATTGIVEVVAEQVREFSIRPLVCDPVLVSKSGYPLLSKDARHTYINKLLPLVDVVTPNLPEASFLCGFPLEDEDDWVRAARTLCDMGAAAVLLKGGHGKGEEVKDLLYDGKEVHTFSAPRDPTHNTHGTGCVCSAALATMLAKGMNLVDAVASAKRFVTEALRFSLPLGHGHGPTNPYAPAFRDAERYRVLGALDQAVRTISRHPGLVHLAPEVQINLGYALPGASTVDEVAAFPGRLVRLPEGLVSVRAPAFGSSHHIARIILSAMRADNELRAAMNVRYSENLLTVAQEKGLVIAGFDRSREPPEIKAREGASLEWGITLAIRESPSVPDIIYDRGDVGKEPMVRVLGRDPQQVVDKTLLLL